MVPVAGLDAQDARVAARAVEVALAEGREEGREVLVGFLVLTYGISILGFFFRFGFQFCKSIHRSSSVLSSISGADGM